MSEAPVYGGKGRIGLIVPANNSVIEPEFWSVLPSGVAAYATRLMARGDLTPQAVHQMESALDHAVSLVAATGVDVIAYCDDGDDVHYGTGVERAHGRRHCAPNRRPGRVGLDGPAGRPCSSWSAPDRTRHSLSRRNPRACAAIPCGSRFRTRFSRYLGYCRDA